MANGKFEQWRTDEGLIILEGWARDGLTDKQIAHNAGISVATLYEWKKRFAEIDRALKAGKEIVDYQVENALLKKALDGDVKAMIFWLKNRRADKWREKPENREEKETAEPGGGVVLLAPVMEPPVEKTAPPAGGEEAGR